MSIGLFLDVDRTLTTGLIQKRFAEMLHVQEEFDKIELKFQQSTNSREFAEELIVLFNSSDFSEDFATKHFAQIELQDWTEDLLHLPHEFQVTIYLVSSGPSYYVQQFADKFGIPKDHVLCSLYEFDANGKLSRCKAVSQQTKADFVRRNSIKHTYTIGVGDSVSHDGPFISNCDIPILTTNSGSGFLFTESLQIIRTLVSNLSKNIQAPARAKPSVFIGCSAEQLDLAEALHGLIDRSCEPTIWRDGVFVPSTTNIESLERALGEFDFAVFIMAPDDTTTSRGTSIPAVRDNVIFELGLFMGRLGRNRCYLVFPRNERPKLPSDLSGIVLVAYDDARMLKDAAAALTPVATALKRSITELGCRSFRL